MKKPSFLKVLQCLTLCLLACTVLPLHVMGEDSNDNVIAYSFENGVLKDYTNIKDAMDASRRNAVYMKKDWEISSPIDIVEGTTSKIYMNGHSIKRVDDPNSFFSHSGEVITMHPNSKLYLIGSDTPVSYKDGTWKSGGFISGGGSYNGGGIYMKKGAYLYMEKVAVCDNHCYDYGGGIYISDDNCTIEMVDAKVNNNYGGYFSAGAGISINGENAYIDLKSNSQISYNTPGRSGGGVFIDDSNATITSKDGTGEISHNTCPGGGAGIYADSDNYTISDLIISDNTAESGGGGIYCQKGSGTLDGLKITGNKTNDKTGGGVKISCKDITIEDCKISDNTAVSAGGGVFVGANYDIYLNGQDIITDNKIKNDVADDVYLENSGVYKAYIIANNFYDNSKIGVRTSSDGDRLIVKRIADVKYLSCFFMDDSDNYHVSFERNDSELWQRKGATSYTVKVNSAPVGKYTKGTQDVRVVDNNIRKDKIFVSWNSDDSTGLTFDENINLKAESISFTMPGNDVNLVANYTDAVKNLSLEFGENAIENGKALPSNASLKWTFNNGNYSEDVMVNWYKKDNGRYVKCNDDDIAQNGVAYIFEVCDEGLADGVHVISNGIQANNITVNNDDISINEASVNDEGVVNFKSKDIILDKDKIAYVDPVVISVKEGASKDSVINTINNNLKSVATSINGYEYDVTLSSPNLDSVSFDEYGNIMTNENGYYLTSISITDDNLDLNGISSTALIINVLPKDEKSETLKVYRIGDDGVTVDGDTFSIDVEIEGTGYDLDGKSYENTTNKVTLTANKGERKTFDLYYKDYNDRAIQCYYVLDDSSAATPEFVDGQSGKNDNGDLYKQIITQYNITDFPKAKVYYTLNENGDNNWTIKNLFSTDVSTASNSYKTIRALAWVVDENNNISSISKKTYVLDNYNRISFNGSFISKIDITIDPLVYGETLPSMIKQIDVTISGNKVISDKDIAINSWTPSVTSASNNTVYQAKVELYTKNSGYSIDYLSSLNVVVNNDDRIYAYIEKENDKAMLYITFPELETSIGAYDDAPLSFNVSGIEVGDYTKEIAYEDAVSINNDVSKLDLPLVAIKTLGSDNNEEYFKADVSYRVVSYFDANNYDSQEIVLEGSIINNPSYIHYNGTSDKFTLRIKVGSKLGYLPLEKAVTCEEYMKSKDWTWSESKKACVYRVSNTASH